MLLKPCYLYTFQTSLERVVCVNTNVWIIWSRFYPASSLVLSPGNVQLNPCVNRAGKLFKEITTSWASGRVDVVKLLLDTASSSGAIEVHGVQLLHTVFRLPINIFPLFTFILRICPDTCSTNINAKTVNLTNNLLALSAVMSCLLHALPRRHPSPTLKRVFPYVKIGQTWTIPICVLLV